MTAAKLIWEEDLETSSKKIPHLWRMDSDYFRSCFWNYRLLQYSACLRANYVVALKRFGDSGAGAFGAQVQVHQFQNAHFHSLFAHFLSKRIHLQCDQC